MSKRPRARATAGLLLLVLAWPAAAGGLPPDECLLMERRARIAGLRGDAQQKLALLEQAVDACPHQISLLLTLERAYQEKQGADDKRRQIRHRLLALAEATTDPISLALIDRAISEGSMTGDDLALFERIARQWVERAPDAPRALEVLARILARQGELEEARELVARLIQLDDGPHYRVNAYYLDRALGRHDDALAYLRSRLEEGDESLMTRLSLISLLADAGRYEELVAHTDPILEEGVVFRALLDVRLIPAGWALYDAGKTEHAESFFRTLLERAPEHDELQRTIYHLFSTDEERAAQEAAMEGRWASEDDPAKLLGEGTTRLAAGDAEAAYGLLERAVAELPQEPVGWVNLGLAALLLERWEDAEGHLTRALALDPDIGDARFNRGVARVQLERYEDALEDLQAFLARDPSRKEAWYYVYRCHRALGNAEAAADALAKYQR